MSKLLQPFPIPGPRISVFGVTGSGKTTTAQRLSVLLGIPHVELDALHWLPGWIPMETEPFRQLVSQHLSGPTWVTDGNYSKARDIIWGRATTLVWLDYSLPLILFQLVQRTIRRIITREVLWSGNHETWKGTLLSKDSLLLWALNTHPRYRKKFPELLSLPEYAGLQLIHFHTRSETNRWLKFLQSETAKKGSE